MRVSNSARIVFFLQWCIVTQAYDLTVIGQIKFAASLSRISLGIIECLKDDLSINVIPTPGDYDLSDISREIQNIIIKSDKRPGKVSLLTDVLWHTFDTPANYVPESLIKIAYSMIEGSAIPREWVDILNKRFDAVAVPDIFCKDVYVQSGVKIPIFVIPCGMCSDELFQRPLKAKPNVPFTFGVSAEFVDRKNCTMLIEAFAREFGSDERVRLRLQGRGGVYAATLKTLITRYKLTNVEIIEKVLTRKEYGDFLASLDCYVLLSKGEGFSLTPREAMALGIPCIITNNSAQKTICATGLVKAVPALIQEQPYYTCFNKCIGYYLNCKVEDAQKAMREVHQCYDVYLKKASTARKWAEQFLYKNLKEQYLTLVKPERVVLSNVNAIEGKVLKTNSPLLYRRYKTLQKGTV